MQTFLSVTLLFVVHHCWSVPLSDFCAFGSNSGLDTEVGDQNFVGVANSVTLSLATAPGCNNDTDVFNVRLDILCASLWKIMSMFKIVVVNIITSFFNSCTDQCCWKY